MTTRLAEYYDRVEQVVATLRSENTGSLRCFGPFGVWSDHPDFAANWRMKSASVSIP